MPGYGVIADETPWGTGRCLRCGFGIASIDKSKPPRQDDGIDFFWATKITPSNTCFFTVKTCSTCGWWYAVEDTDVCNNGAANVYAGILQQFDIGSVDIPIHVLKSELPKNIAKIDGIHPKRMETLVASILAGVYDCEVKQLGYTRDGGVDLIILNSDTPIAVQVKRRESHHRTECVSKVREFLGASLLKGFRNLLFVTNAQRYSKDAVYAAKQSVDIGLVDKFDLISLDTLQGLLPHGVDVDIWRESIASVIRKEYEMPYIPDPYHLDTVPIISPDLS